MSGLLESDLAFYGFVISGVGLAVLLMIFFILDARRMSREKERKPVRWKRRRILRSDEYILEEP